LQEKLIFEVNLGFNWKRLSMRVELQF